MPISRQDVLSAAELAGGPAYVHVLDELLAWGERQSSLVEEPHQGSQTVAKFALNVSQPGRLFFEVYPHQHKLVTRFRTLAPVSEEPLRGQMLALLHAIPDLQDDDLPDDSTLTLRLRPLTSPTGLQSLLAAMDWALERIATVERELIVLSSDATLEDSFLDREAALELGEGTPEGRLRLAAHFRRERRRDVVERKKRHALTSYGNLACEVCQFDFAATFGALGDGFCEVHHRTPLSQTTGVTVTHLNDLAIVCANCHRMLHRRDPLYTTAELQMLRAGAA